MQEDNCFAEWFNEPHHGLSPDEVAGTLHAMFQDGEIVAHWNERRRGQTTFVPTREQIDRALGGRSLFEPEGFDYGLTALGAQLWEEIACPDWSRYFAASGHYDASGQPDGLKATCADRSRVEQYLASSNFDILSARWDVVSPWQVTYWKWLPLGHRVHYYSDAYAWRPAHIELDAAWWNWFDDPF